MIIQLIPFYYLTSKISSEKESKAREGMKMMGLTDDTYYLAWLIVYSIITFVTSIIVTGMCAIGVFDNINMFMFFVMCFLYGMCMYGQAFFIVAFLPSKRSSGIAATLFHIITFYMVFILQDPATPSTALYSFSLLPNICMVELIKQIFFYNYNTRDGLTWSTLGIQYQNYSFKGGILVLLLDTLVWGFIGLYLD
jgi:ATP-binding cassette, subfamily A (ABC1), member 3